MKNHTHAHTHTTAQHRLYLAPTVIHRSILYPATTSSNTTDRTNTEF